MARKFNGTSDYITLNEAAGDVTSNFTLLFWFKLHAGWAQYDRLITKKDTVDWNFPDGWYLEINTSGQATFVGSGSGISRVTLVTPEWQNDVWYHLAIRFYTNTYDAILDDNSPVTSGVIDTIVPNNRIVTIAYYYYYGAYTPATFANMALINRVLSVSEVEAFRRGRWVRGPYLFWLPLYGNASPEPDLSGNGYNGTVTGTTQVDHPPVAPPFGFDMGWAGAYTAPTAGGLSIPVAMHHYNLMRG